MADKFADRFPPSVVATKLYERTSAKGNPYLTGRWGGLRVAVLKTQEQDSEGNAIWEVRFSSRHPALVPKRRRPTLRHRARESLLTRQSIPTASVKCQRPTCAHVRASTLRRPKMKSHSEEVTSEPIADLTT
jgi:hypothetical protein